MKLKSVVTVNAPAPAGHYSQAIVHDGIVYVSGQLGIHPADRERKAGSIGEQTEQALQNIREILRAAGSDLDRVLKMTVYVSDMSLWGTVNTVFSRIMGDHRPARAVVPTKELNYGFHVEIDAIAAAGERSPGRIGNPKRWRGRNRK